MTYFKMFTDVRLVEILVARLLFKYSRLVLVSAMLKLI